MRGNRMNIYNWEEMYIKEARIYKTNIDNEQRAKVIVNDFKSALSDKKIILYGAGTVGRIFVNLLNELNMNIFFVIDKNAERIGFINKEKVYNNEKLLEINGDLNTYVIIATVNRTIYSTVLDDISGLGIKTDNVICGHDIHMVLQSAWCMIKACGKGSIQVKNCYECTNLDNTCLSYERYLKRINNFIDEGKGTTKYKLIGYILGNICTLKCKNCCELVPYMPTDIKKFTSYENVIKDIIQLSTACNFLPILEFVGGEPFLHPDLKKILKRVIDIENIGIIHIFTNGTVVPDDEMCELLASNRIIVYISNYQATLPDKLLHKISITDEKLRKYNVNCFFGKKQNWSDFSQFELCNTDDELNDVFEACYLHNCHRIQDGTLYTCPHQYAGIKLNKLKEKDEVVYIHDYSIDELSIKLEEYQTRKHFDSCHYCAMPFKAKTVISGEQL